MATEWMRDGCAMVIQWLRRSAVLPRERERPRADSQRHSSMKILGGRGWIISYYCERDELESDFPTAKH